MMPGSDKETLKIGEGKPGPGRPPGLANKATRTLKTAILNAFEKVGGEEYLIRVAREDPKTFCTLLGKVLPTQLAGDPDTPLHPTPAQNPGKNCAACCDPERSAKLHGPERYFLCRHCYHLAHASQSEGALDRTLRHANKIRQRLGGDPGMAARFPPKPKGMWWRTYNHLRAEVFEAEMDADEAIERRTERLLAQLDEPKRSRPNRNRSFWR